MSAFAHPCVSTYIWRRVHTHMLAAVQKKWPSLGAHTKRPSKADPRRDTLKVKNMHEKWA